MRLKTTVIGPTTYKTFRKELLVLILGQPPRHWFSSMGTFLPFEIITYAI
jgi:hypothetical protein